VPGLRRKPRPLSTSRSTAHGGRVRKPLGHMGRYKPMSKHFVLIEAGPKIEAGSSQMQAGS